MPPCSRLLDRARASLLGALAGVLVGVLALGLLVVAPPAGNASSTYLCTGYSACNRAGYSDGGYGANNGRMYWRMYAGHNCTNYVAYRMIRAGMSGERPWSGSGMAYNWGHVRSDITDQTPRVGAVAWWDRNSGGVGSSGHVAVVERVVSSREIVVSEDSWGGDFDWRRIVRDGRGWPSGFIHFVDQPARVLTSTSPPTVTGTPRVGAPLRATAGGWAGGPTSYAYQWQADGTSVPGATAASYTPTTAQRGSTLAVQVTARRSGYEPGTASSASTAPIDKGAFAITTPTTVTGTPQVGETLTATAATFAPEPATRNLQWRADGVVIPGVRRPHADPRRLARRQDHHRADHRPGRGLREVHLDLDPGRPGDRCRDRGHRALHRRRPAATG